MAQVLYRKHRPKSFSEVTGQEHVTQTLKNALKMGEVAHAYLFTGPRGTGKTTTARLLTKAINCTQGKNDACTKCNNCLAIDAGSFVDLIEIDAASNRGIDEIRQLKEAVRFSPSQGERKVYLIDEVHMLTKEAFNALLKTLEEPPEHAMFILATTEPHKVLPTIISRTQRFDFRFLTADEIAERLNNILKKENKELDSDAVKIIVSAAGGSMRDAESVLGKVISMGSVTTKEVRELLGVTDLGKISTLVGHIMEGEKEKSLEHLNILTGEGTDLQQFTDNFIQYVRNLMLIKLSPSSESMLTASFTDEESETASRQAHELTEKQIYDILREFIAAGQEIKNSPLPQLPLELAVVNLTS